MKFLRVLTILCAVLAMPLAAQAKLILADTGDTVEVVTASGVSTINVYAAWADITTTTLTPGLTNSLITTATTTTVVAAPGASTQRQVKMLTIYNSHASSSNAISVQVYDGTNRAVLVKYTLLAGETLQWSEDENFRVLDASGQIKSVVAADTELPAAAALADNTANPTTSGLAAYMMCYDGSTWDRCLASPNVAHDADGSSANPLLIGCYSSAAAPTDVTADTEAVRAWCLRNGARAIQPTFAGVLATTGNGASGTGVQRVTIANDSTGVIGLATGSNTIGALTANQSVNVAQINGVTPLMGAGNTGTGSPRVTIATDQAAIPGMGVYVEDAAETAGGNLSMAGTVRRDTMASSAGATGDNATANTDANGLLWTRNADPCSALAKTFLPINISTATTTEITPSLAGASNYYYVCSINIGPVAGAQNLALVDDDSDGCGSVTSGVAGGTTAGSGWNLAANGGLTFGNGLGSIAKTNGTNRVLCLVSSAAVQTSGVISVVAAP